MAELIYRAADDQAAVQAVLLLVQHARTSQADFSFGPSDWAAITQQGLRLSGDTAAAAGLLATVPGLVEESA